MKVEALMTRSTQHCSPRDSLADAARMMWDQDCGSLPVVANAQVRRLPVTDDAGRLLGILSLNDLALAAERGRASKVHEVELTDVALTLSAVCRRPFPTVVVGV